MVIEKWSDQKEVYDSEDSQLTSINAQSMTKAFACLFYILFNHCASPVQDCPKKTWSQKMLRRIPPSVCINSDQMIYGVYDNFDYNGDGFADLALKIGREKRKDGDTLYLNIYQGKEDSSFFLAQTYNNVFPVFFRDYDLEAPIVNRELQQLKNRFQGRFPVLNQLQISNDTLTLRLYADVGYEYFYRYVYRPKVDNWVLSVLEEYDTFEEDFQIIESFDLGTSLEKFNYFLYLEGEDF